MAKIIREVVNEETLAIEKVEENYEGAELISVYNDMMQSSIQKLNCTPEEFSDKYHAYKKAEKEFKEIFEPFKESILTLHEKNSGLPVTAHFQDMKVTYVGPSIRTSIDSKKLKEEEPAIAEKYTKTTEVKASLRLS